GCGVNAPSTAASRDDPALFNLRPVGCRRTGRTERSSIPDTIGMPRPTKPLIVRDAVIEAALRIIDLEGLDTFSLPRLARELNVQAPSLYHHFADKSAILVEVARSITAETKYPDPKSVSNWIEWLVAFSLAARQSILRHPNAVPVLLQFMPRDLMTRDYNASAQYLAEIGVPVHRIVVVLDGLDRLTMGAGVVDALGAADQARQLFSSANPDSEPDLAAAVAANRLTPAGVFAETIRGFLRGAAPEVPETAPPPQHWG
ncbi:TetR/AcrR family transcriptional regulator, partial [Mycobacterium syngnathidarum]